MVVFLVVMGDYDLIIGSWPYVVLGGLVVAYFLAKATAVLEGVGRASGLSPCLTDLVRESSEGRDGSLENRKN